MPRKQFCCNCGGKSDFAVMLDNDNDKAVGTLFFCEDCRHVVNTYTADIWKAMQKRIPLHLSSVPDKIDSLN
jgi:hypothetical protein